MSAFHLPGLHGEFSNVFGGAFTGNLLTAICFGAITVQTTRYFHLFSNDSRSTRSIVTFLWIVEAFQLACVTQSMWHYFIANFGQLLLMTKATWEFSIYQIGSVTSSATVQTFFAYRVYALSGRVWFGCLVELFAVVQAGFGIAISVKAITILEFPTFVEEYTWLVLCWLGCQAAADIVIASAMCGLLRARRTGFRNTDTVINLMTVYTINTGLVTALLSIIILITFARAGFHYIVLTLGLPLGGFYTFTMMANLHSRIKIAERWTSTHSANGGGQSWGMSNMSKGTRRETATYLTGHSDEVPTRDGQLTHPPVVIDVIEAREVVVEDVTAYDNEKGKRGEFPSPRKPVKNITFAT